MARLSDAGSNAADTVANGLTEQVGEFAHRVEALRRRVGSANVDGDLLEALGELDVAHEELRVAEEEMRAQQDQIERLLHGRERSREGLRRVLLGLPVPMLGTDREGRVVDANGAAAALFGRGPQVLVRKPLVTLVADTDRPVVRDAVSRARSVVDSLALSLTLRTGPRGRREVPVTAVLLAAPDERDRLQWVMVPDDGMLDAPGAVASATAFASIADLLRSGQEDEQTVLSEAAVVIERALSAADAVSLTLGDPLAPQRVGSDSRLAQTVDGAQLAAGEGPCHDAFRDRDVVVTADVRTDPRWPRLARRLTEVPVHSVLAVPLEAGADCPGVLNVYAEKREAYGSSAVRLADLMGAAISAVLQDIEERRRLSAYAQQLEEALSSRAVIDQAKGIIMAERGGTPEEAFARLSAMSQRSNIKLREVARLLVEDASGRPGG